MTLPKPTTSDFFFPENSPSISLSLTHISFLSLSLSRSLIYFSLSHVLLFISLSHTFSYLFLLFTSFLSFPRPLISTSFTTLTPEIQFFISFSLSHLLISQLTPTFSLFPLSSPPLMPLILSLYHLNCSLSCLAVTVRRTQR